MWKISKDKSGAEEIGLPSRKGWTSPDYVEGTKLPHKFRMSDDDGNIYYYGYSDDNNSEEAFAPLDDLGTPDVGAKIIEYYNEGKWEIL